MSCIHARYLNHDGYPMHGEHRRAYEDAKGSIPAGYTLDHTCRVRSCINPDHLEAVTFLENQRRKPTTKIPFEDREKIAKRLERGEKASALAKEYDVSTTRIYQMRRTVIPKTQDLLDAVEDTLNDTVAGS